MGMNWKQEHGFFSLIKIIQLLHFLFVLALTPSLLLFFSALFFFMSQPPSWLRSPKPLLNNIQSCFCVCFWHQPISPHCKVVISLPEKWHDCCGLLFRAASYHYTENVTIPPSCPAESSLGLKSFQKAICHPLSQAEDQTRGPALVSTPSKRYQGPVFLFISASIIIQLKKETDLWLSSWETHWAIAGVLSLKREPAFLFWWWMEPVFAASGCVAGNGFASYAGPLGRIVCGWRVQEGRNR